MKKIYVIETTAKNENNWSIIYACHDEETAKKDIQKILEKDKKKNMEIWEYRIQEINLY